MEPPEEKNILEVEPPEEKELCYDTSHKSRGKALVINYTVNRLGSEKDTRDVIKVLEKLQFKVEVGIDLKEIELLQLIQKVADEDHSDSDCFVMVVMAHGSKEKIQVGNIDFAVDRLWQNFVGNNCPSLKGKPKLFFIQACRGSLKETAPVLNTEEGENQAEASPPGSNEESFILPMHADMLMMYATYYEYIAVRNTVHGSWFIQSLCKVLSRDIRQKELLSLLTDVSYEVVFKLSGKGVEPTLQIPMITSMLTKKFYFVEKDVPTVKESN